MSRGLTPTPPISYTPTTHLTQEEKEQNRLLAGDLELTQRNMKKTLDQLKEQLGINERLMGVIKVRIALLLCLCLLCAMPYACWV